MRSSSALSAVRSRWQSFLPAWLFPVFFLAGGVTSERLGHPQAFFFIVATPLFFWSVSRAMGPWRRGELGYWVCAFWGIMIPFAIWVVAVLVRLAFIGELRGVHAA